MSNKITIEIQGTSIDDDNLADIGEYEIVTLKRFEGHTELVQVIVPIAATGYLTLSRILTFVERLLDKSHEKEIRIRVLKDAQMIGKQIRNKSDIDLLKKALSELSEL